jgi:iron complex transport system ATP-binding protein
MTVFFALHDLNLAARSCDHVVVLDGGRVAAEGKPAEVLTPELLQRVYGVAARLLPDPQSGRPLIIYDDAAP